MATRTAPVTVPTPRAPTVITPLTETACGHTVPDMDTTGCSADPWDRYCGDCYDTHATGCTACNAQDAADYYDAWE